MNDDNWYLRNRSREAIIDMVRVIRQLQLINNFKVSSIFRAIATVYRETDDELTSVQLWNLIRDMERGERRRR